MTTRADIIAAARSWIGTPYRHQASLKGVGCDCLGLARGVWREVMGCEPEVPPPYTRDWARHHSSESFAEAAARYLVPIAIGAHQPADVLLFALKEQMPATHCAILTAPDRMVHATESHPVAEVSLAPWWLRRLRFAFAFPDLRDQVSAVRPPKQPADPSLI